MLTTAFKSVSCSASNYHKEPLHMRAAERRACGRADARRCNGFFVSLVRRCRGWFPRRVRFAPRSSSWEWGCACPLNHWPKDSGNAPMAGTSSDWLLILPKPQTMRGGGSVFDNRTSPIDFRHDRITDVQTTRLLRREPCESPHSCREASQEVQVKKTESIGEIEVDAVCGIPGDSTLEETSGSDSQTSEWTMRAMRTRRAD